MRISDWSSDVCSSDLIEQRGIADVDALARLDHQHWPLVPFCVRATDHRCQRHLGQRADDRLDLAWVDPFAARFDEILHAAGNADHAVAIDDSEIAGDRKSTRLNSSH